MEILQEAALGAIFVCDIAKGVERLYGLPANFTLMEYSPIIQRYMPISKQVLIASLIGFLALGVRLPGLGKFMTADEENWMLRSGQFYHNLFRNSDTGGAFITTHPGATAMWIAGAGIVWQEARLGFDIDTSNIVHFRRAALVPMVIVISVLIGLAVWQVIELFGRRAGLAAGVLLALEPYLVGMSQIVHVDMLLALFMVNSVLAFFLHLQGVPRSYTLEVSAGVFAGLALGTKLLPALWLFVFFAIMLLWPRMRGAPRINFEKFIRSGGFIFGIAMLTFWAAWPALWFTSDLGRSFEKDVPSVIQDAHVAVEKSDEPIAPASFYARTMLGRTTPFVLILAAASAVIIFLPLRRGGWSSRGETEGSNLRWLFIYVVGFLVLITFVSKKADRYALPALVMLPIIAGLALSKFPTLHLRGVKWGTALVAGLLLAQVLLLPPHTIAYNSPVFDVRPASQQGWGEGLEEAAAWLNAQSNAEELYAASWYPGVLRAYFRGKTLGLSSRGDDRVGYVVLYRNMFGRGADDAATNILDEFRDAKPAQVIYIGELPYVWIYDIRGLHYYPQHVGELYGETSVGQLLPISENNWHSIEIGLATFSSRGNTQDVILHVRESVDSRQDTRAVRVNASEIQDSSYHQFEFEPISESAGKTYYVFFESPTSRAGDAVTVRFANQDILPGEMVKDGKVLPGRDIAYRLP